MTRKLRPLPVVIFLGLWAVLRRETGYYRPREFMVLLVRSWFRLRRSR